MRRESSMAASAKISARRQASKYRKRHQKRRHHRRGEWRNNGIGEIAINNGGGIEIWQWRQRHENGAKWRNGVNSSGGNISVNNGTAAKA